MTQAFNRDCMEAIFDIGAVDAAYLSQKKEEEN